MAFMLKVNMISVQYVHLFSAILPHF